MDPIGRELNPEEQAVLIVLGQEGRTAEDRTAIGVSAALERDLVDISGLLLRLERDGLVSREPGPDGEERWTALAVATD